MITRTVRDMESPVTTTSDQFPEANVHLNELAKLADEGTLGVLALTEAIETNRGAIRRALEGLRIKLGSEHSTDLEQLVETVKTDECRLTDIHVALSFQDLVTQRVAKVMTILKDVQYKLLKLVIVFGIKQKKDGTGRKDSGRGDEMLRQLEASQSTVLEQDLVDEILSEYGYS